MKLFGKKDGVATPPDATDDLGDVDAGFEEIEGAPAAPPASLSAPSRKFAGAGGGRKNIVIGGLLVAILALGGGYFFFMNNAEVEPIHVTAAINPDPAQPGMPPAPAPATPDATASAAAIPPAADPNALPPATAAADPMAATTPVAGSVDPLASPAVAATPGMPPAPAADTTPAGAPVDPFAQPPAAAADPATAGTAPADPATSAAAAATLGAPPVDDAAPADEITTDAPLAATTPAATPQPAAAGTTALVAPAPGEAAPDWAAPGTATVPGTTNPAAKATSPSDAELAIVQHADVIDQLSRPAAAPGATPAANGNAPFDPKANATSNAAAMKTVTEILEQKGIVRPLPSGYMTIRKESSAGNVDSRLTAARSALSQGRNAAALELFDELHHDYPKDKRILMGRAVSLHKLGQTDAALAAYEAVLNRDPKNIDALNNMLGLLKAKDPQLALEKLQELQAAYPSQPDIAAQLGVAYASSGQYDLALRYLDVSDSIKPGSTFVLYNKSVLMDKTGHPAEAARMYRQILRLAADGELDIALPLDSIRSRLAALR